MNFRLFFVLPIFLLVFAAAHADPPRAGLPDQEQQRLREQMREAWREHHGDHGKEAARGGKGKLGRCRTSSEASGASEAARFCTRHKRLREELRRRREKDPESAAPDAN